LTFATGSPVITQGELLDTTSAKQTAINDSDNILGSLSRDDVQKEFDQGKYKGWFLELDKRSSRLSVRPSAIEELGFFTDFQPTPKNAASSSQCVISGGGFLTVLDVRTGLFVSNDRLSIAGRNINPTTDFVNARVSSSFLSASQILMAGNNPDGSQRIIFKAPGTNQEVVKIEFDLKQANSNVGEGRKSWREIEM